MTGSPVRGSRACRWITDAPASTHSATSAAISSGVMGTAGLASRVTFSLSPTATMSRSVRRAMAGAHQDRRRHVNRARGDGAREAARMARLLSDEELDALARTPREQVATALETGD